MTGKLLRSVCPYFSLIISILFGLFGAAHAQEGDRQLGAVQYEHLPAEQPGARQWMVLIAIDDYHNSRLDNLDSCRADAMAFRDVMRSSFGYTDECTIELYNEQATAPRIRQLFYDLPDKVGTSDSVIIYFAGHGYFDPRRQMGFWYAFDAQDVWDGIANSTVKDWCRALPASKVLVIADSCFAGSLVTRAGFLPDATLKSRELLSSGGLHPVADVGSPDGMHSVFNHYLRKSLLDLAAAGKPFALTDLYIRIVPPVKANSSQEPQRGIIQDTFHEGGQFLFYPQGEIPAGDGRTNIASPIALNPVDPATPRPEPGIVAQESQLVPGRNARLRIAEDVYMNFVYIPPGSFVMGSPGGEDAEEPLTQVRITRGFWMGETEVTQVQWKAVMGSSHSWFRGDNLPADQVSWYDAREFCQKLAARLDIPVNLPTEAQWEYACRAGTTTAFSFGDDESLIDEYAWYSGNANRRTHPVASKKPNPLGLYDMHGNVFEWCLDSLGDYPGGRVSDWRHTDDDEMAIGRGGSWVHPPDRLRSSSRGNGPRGSRLYGVGLRIVINEE